MITMVYSYYKNGAMFERQLEEWQRYDSVTRERMRAIVVDDGSPTDPAAERFQRFVRSSKFDVRSSPPSNLEPGTSNSSIGFPVEIYRIKENIPWNFHGARNLGMDRAPDGWCLLTDIDHVLEAEQARILTRKKLASGCFYIPARRYAGDKPVHPHPDTAVMERSLYWRVGGCDEDFSGYYSPGELYLHNAATVAIRENMPDVFLRLVTASEVPDANTVDFGRKGSEYHWKKNPYLQRKWRSLPYRPTNPLRFEWEKVNVENCSKFEVRSSKLGERNLEPRTSNLEPGKGAA